MTNRLVSQRFSRRGVLIVLLHALIFTFSLWLAFALKSDFAISSDDLRTLLLSLPAFLAVKLIVFFIFGQYRQSWRTVTLTDLAKLMEAALVSSVCILALDKLVIRGSRALQDVINIPRAVILLDFGVTIMLLGGMRASYRMVREEFRFLFSAEGVVKTLIVGANPTGQTLSRYLAGLSKPNYIVLGYLDQDPSRRGSMFGGIPILGSPEKACQLASTLGAHQIMVVSDTLSGKQLRSLMNNCAGAGVRLKVIPAFDKLLSGDFKPQIRDVEINDLLRREPVELSDEAIGELLADRVIFVTGAGGSIGSEICRQVLRFKPRQLVLVERAENSLFLIEQELRLLKCETEIIPAIADITDRTRIDTLFGEFRPAVVFHAAAHKHVPMMEYNPGEAIKNNVLGTKSLVELADKHAVQEFVMISTDKAVNPTSVMGVSKQLAERFVHAYSEISSTKFVVVRFGNVLASNGSVVPIFQEQIRRGGPITVTHPDIERFFMTIPEASQLVLQAAAMGRGGEIFVLDMGESVKIVNLAQDLVRLSGLSPEDIEIVFTGLRPGEKLYEELYFDDEEMLPTPHSKLFVAYHRPYHLSEVSALIENLSVVLHCAPDAVRQKVRELVPEYRGVDLAAEPVASAEASHDEPNADENSGAMSMTAATESETEASPGGLNGSANGAHAPQSDSSSQGALS